MNDGTERGNVDTRPAAACNRKQGKNAPRRNLSSLLKVGVLCNGENRLIRSIAPCCEPGLNAPYFRAVLDDAR
jgi:hypothetical protein